MLQQLSHRLGGPWGPGLQWPAQVGALLHQPRRPGLVMQAKHLLAGMAQGGMAHVMEQGCAINQAAMLCQLRGEPLEMLQGAASQVKNADGMGEAAGFSAVEGEKGRPQLADAPQALKRRGIDQGDHHRLGWIVAVENDFAVERIVIRATLHASSCLISASSALRNQASSSLPMLLPLGSVLLRGSSGSSPCP